MRNKVGIFLIGVGLILVVSGILGKAEIGLLIGWVFGYIIFNEVKK